MRSDEIPDEETPIYVIMVPEKRLDSQAQQHMYLSKAFPELVDLDVIQGKLAIVGSHPFACLWLAWDEWKRPEYKEQFVSYVRSIDEGFHVLSQDWWARESKISGWEPGMPVTREVLEYNIELLLIQRFTGYATSGFVVKWRVIEGPQLKDGLFGKPRQSKILAVGIYPVPKARR